MTCVSGGKDRWNVDDTESASVGPVMERLTNTAALDMKRYESTKRGMKGVEINPNRRACRIISVGFSQICV